MSHPLADALRGIPGEGQPLGWLSGVLVTAVNTAVTPHTVTLRLADGAVVPDVPFLGWWAPRVDDRVEVIRRGTSLMVLGPVAPAALSTVTAPSPPVAPAAPPEPLARRTVTVQPTNMGSWDVGGSYWRSYMTQGGGKRAFWVYGDGIAAAKGAGSIVAATAYVERLSTEHGVRGAANVRLGTHGESVLPTSGAAAHANVAVRATLNRGKGRVVALDATQVSALNAGAKGLGLEPGDAGYDVADYLRVTDGAPSGALALTIEG